MSMFDNYDNIDPSMKPNNTTIESNSDVKIVDDSKPTKMYDVHGKLKGYSWNDGDMFEFIVPFNKTIKVSNDSIVYEKSMEKPNSTTVGHTGLIAYNTKDYKSWTCIGFINGMYIWIENDEMLCSPDGEKEITFDEDMSTKVLRVCFYNFRGDEVFSFESAGEDKVVCIIDSEFYDKVLSGVYNVELKIVDEFSISTIDKFFVSIY